MHFSTRVSVELLGRLKQVASRRGVSLHELVGQAFELLVWVDSQQEAGATFVVETSDGEVCPVVFDEHLVDEGSNGVSSDGRQ